MQFWNRFRWLMIIEFFAMIHIRLILSWLIIRKFAKAEILSFMLWTCKNMIIIIINSYILMTSIRSTHERLYAMCIEWTKLSEIENHSLSIRLLHAVETTRLRLCIKFVHVDRTLENECSSHSKLLQKLYFHYHSHCCSEIFRDRDDYSIVQEVNVT